MIAGKEREITQQDRDAVTPREQLLAEQVTQLYRQSRLTVMGAVLCSAIVVVTLWSEVPPWRLVVWFLCYAVIHCVRQAVSTAFEKRVPIGDAANRWANYFHLTAAISALIWGSTAVFLFPVNSLEHQFILLACVAGISCGAAVVYSPTNCYITVILLDILPFAGRFFYEGGTKGTPMAVVIVLFAVVLLYIGRRVHLMNAESLRNGFDRSNLVASLWSQKALADELNADLKLEIAERSRAEAALKRSERQYRQLVDNANDFMFLTDSKGVFTLVNPVSQRLTGYTPEEIIGRHFSELVHPDHVNELRRFYGTQSAREIPESYYEFPVITKDGSTIWLGQNVGLVTEGEKIIGFQGICRDITLRKEAEERLRHSEERYRSLYQESTRREEIYRSLLSSSADAVVIYDLERKATYVNPAFTRIFGWTPEEVLGSRIPFVPKEEHDSTDALMQDIVEAGSPRSSIETKRFTRDGRVLDISLSASLYHDHEGKPAGILVVSRDISDQKRAAKELEKAFAAATQLRAEAEAANLAKSEFLANMSHELRTPLNAIIGFSEVLADQIFGNLNDKQLRHVGHVVNSGHHLLQVINEILDLSKVESGTMELRPDRTDVPELMENALMMIRETALKNGLRTKLRVDEEFAGTYVYVDQVKMKQILFNLLSNAARFTPEGGTIELEARRNNDLLQVRVADTGIGVEQKDRERIFRSFEQVDSSYARRQQGTGLGLTLTKRLVELHGGRIWVESEGDGKGSTFTFEIPTTFDARRDDDPEDSRIQRMTVAEEAPEPVHEARLGSHAKVLVVDDDSATNEMICHALTEAGYSVARAFDGRQVVEMAARIRPMAITLDVIMPDRDGFDTLAELKHRAETRDIPVIVVTIHDNRKLALSLGAVDLLPKPLDKDRLLGILRRLEAQQAQKGLVAMVVDDDPAALEHLSQLLSSHGYAVIPAYGGLHGMKLAAARRPDVIILDLLMPDVTGFDMADQLRGTPETKDTPIIVYTAKDLTSEDQDRLQEIVQGIALKSGAGNELLQQLDQLRTVDHVR
jgi:PAS domain S-box-containing protein